MPSAFFSRFSYRLAQLDAIKRVSIGLVAGIASYFVLALMKVKAVTSIMIGWDVFSILMVIMCWIIFFYIPEEKMSQLAQREDESRTIIFFIVLISLLISLFGILFLRNSSDAQANKNLHVTVSMLGVVFSWLLLHTIFTLHYAHLYYDDPDKKNGAATGNGLEFLNEANPDYLDFAYFSFVIGMTFQVSDVGISSRKIRRMALLHGIIAFLYNTIIVALTISILAD